MSMNSAIDKVFILYYTPKSMDFFQWCIKLYLMATRQWNGFTHVGLVLRGHDDNDLFIEACRDGVLVRDTFDYGECQAYKLQEFPKPVSEAWIFDSLVYAVTMEYQFPIQNYIRYPFVKRKPMVCTGLVEHLLLLPLVNNTPKALMDKVEEYVREPSSIPRTVS